MSIFIEPTACSVNGLETEKVSPKIIAVWQYTNIHSCTFFSSGFSTLKGELVRSIMFPKPVDFKFSQDTYKFIGALAGIASIGMVYTIVIMVGL